MISCPGCGRALTAEALACDVCHALVHGAEIERLVADARALTQSRQYGDSRERWREALRLLPPQTQQATWIVEQIRALGDFVNVPLDAPADSTTPRWLRWLGPLAPILLVLTKGKAVLALFNAKFLLSLGAFIGVYWSLFGMAFGIGFAVLILIHELGHYIDIRRRGLPADMPVFLPGVGAYVRWEAIGVSPSVRAFVSLAGPLAGTIASLACAVQWRATGAPIWAALGHTSAWLNALNLIPVPILDGGHATLALARPDRAWLLVSSLACWYLFGEGVFFLVALGAAWRLFTSDQPETSNPRVLTYYVFLLIALGGLLHFLPDPRHSSN